jgi:replication-associated recombination protein RarA
MITHPTPTLHIKIYVNTLSARNERQYSVRNSKYKATLHYMLRNVSEGASPPRSWRLILDDSSKTKVT